MTINRERLQKEASQHGIEFIVLFGSRASGKTHREESDFDVAVLTESGRDIHSSLGYYSEILFFLVDVLGIPDRKLDLANMNSANPLFRYEIVSGGTLLFGNQNDYDEYRAFAFKDFVDAKPLFSLERFLINKRQKLFKEALSS